MDTTPEIDALIREAGEGNGKAAERLVAETHRELHRVARMIMNDQRANHTLQATALVNEAFVRLAIAGPGEVDDLSHFIRKATKTMRTALIDHERAKRAEKRGGDQLQVSLSINAFGEGEIESSKNLVDVDASLRRLEELDPELAQVVELRYFGGLEVAEVAAAIGLPKRTVERRWQTARMFLLKDLSSSG